MDEYVRLAKAALETYVTTGKRMKVPDGLPAELLQNRAGVFVSLKKDGDLRGCIGTVRATTGSVAEEILAYAVIAGTEDPRFPAVRAEELPAITYSVDVLGDAEETSMDGLDAKEYGVIVSNGLRRGLLLPNLTGVNTPAEQVRIALQKAGIRPDEPFGLERFRVVRHT